MQNEQNEHKSDPLISDLLQEQYENAPNRNELDYWKAFATLVTEFMKLRAAKGLSQKDIAEKMKTKQSVVSRFENMGRKPSYDFLVRLAKAFGGQAGMTLFGDFMATVSLEKQDTVRDLAERSGLKPRDYIEQVLNRAIDDEITRDSASSWRALLQNRVEFQPCAEATMPAGVGYISWMNTARETGKRYYPIQWADMSVIVTEAGAGEGATAESVLERACS